MCLSADAGQALVEVGESYKQLAEIKYSMEDTVKQNFLEPLQSLQSKDLKEVNVCTYFHGHRLIFYLTILLSSKLLCFWPGATKENLYR